MAGPLPARKRTGQEARLPCRPPGLPSPVMYLVPPGLQAVSSAAADGAFGGQALAAVRSQSCWYLLPRLDMPAQASHMGSGVCFGGFVYNDVQCLHTRCSHQRPRTSSAGASSRKMSRAAQARFQSPAWSAPDSSLTFSVRSSSASSRPRSVRRVLARSQNPTGQVRSHISWLRT